MSLKTVCQKGMCTGCGACLEICQYHAIKLEDCLIEYNAIIDDSICKKCNACHIICQNNNHPIMKKPSYWFQGWAKDTMIRKEGSSGGIASALSQAFIKMGGFVCSCEFKDGKFLFSIENEREGMLRFAGSKYVKSNPRNIYRQVNDRLKSGDKVLFIGLPCQVAALLNFVGSRNLDNLYTVDLICHGTPSPELLEHFLRQYKLSLNDIKDIKFRKKSHFQLYQNKGDYLSITPEGVLDCYMRAFLGCLDYTENCYQCNYARLERVSDITIGDSWGSELPEDEQNKGVSLILCQTQKGFELVNSSNLCLHSVDLSKAVENNKQLNYPSEKPIERKKFFRELENGKTFNQAFRKCFPRQYYRLLVKGILLKLHLIHRERGGEVILNNYCISIKR